MNAFSVGASLGFEPRPSRVAREPPARHARDVPSDDQRSRRDNQGRLRFVERRFDRAPRALRHCASSLFGSLVDHVEREIASVFERSPRASDGRFDAFVQRHAGGLFDRGEQRVELLSRGWVGLVAFETTRALEGAIEDVAACFDERVCIVVAHG